MKTALEILGIVVLAIVIFCVVCVVVCVAFSPLFWADCNNRQQLNPDLEFNYTIVSGCMVKLNGFYIPVSEVNWVELLNK